MAFFWVVYFLIERDDYVKDVWMIAMRDGVELYTEVYVPGNVSVHEKEMAVLMLRTPYPLIHVFNVQDYAILYEGYYIVVQSIRGTGESQGNFHMLDVPEPGKTSESTDTYDTIEFVLEKYVSNGNVGIFGISYSGWTTLMATIGIHPSIKAISPQAPPESMFIGDDFLHNGALRLSPTFGYSYLMEYNDINNMSENPFFDYGEVDVYDYFINSGNLEEINENVLHHKSPTWNAVVEYSNYSEFWQKLTFGKLYNELSIPSLVVGGWFDTQDFYGTIKTFEIQTRLNSSNSYLLLGPWSHASWQYSSPDDGETLGTMHFGSPTFKIYREYYIQFFNYHLKNIGENPIPKITSFRTGENKWYNYTEVPTGTLKRLYFLENGSLGIYSMNDSNQFLNCYVSDPQNPTPYKVRPIKGFWSDQGSGSTYKTEDQSFLDGRTDIKTYSTQQLDEDIVVTGNITATINAAITGTDIDWYVKIIDVFPDGFKYLIATRGIRGKFRNSLTTPEPVIPSKLTTYHIDLLFHDHLFKKDHKIMVILSNYMFPLHDRNPQTFTNIPTAQASSYIPSTNCINPTSFIEYTQSH